MRQKQDKQYLRDKAEVFVEFAIGGLLPEIAKADKALEVYNARPSIYTGATRQEAEDEALAAIATTKKMMWKVWKDEFKGAVSAKDYCQMMEDAITKLRPEGEGSTSGGSYWLDKAGDELNGKDGE